MKFVQKTKIIFHEFHLSVTTMFILLESSSHTFHKLTFFTINLGDMIPSTCSLKNHITRVNGGKIQCVKYVVRSFKQNKYWKDMKIECITYHCNIIVQMKSCFIWGQNIFTIMVHELHGHFFGHISVLSTSNISGYMRAHFSCFHIVAIHTSFTGKIFCYRHCFLPESILTCLARDMMKNCRIFFVQ